MEFQARNKIGHGDAGAVFVHGGAGGHVRGRAHHPGGDGFRIKSGPSGGFGAGLQMTLINIPPSFLQLFV